MDSFVDNDDLTAIIVDDEFFGRENLKQIIEAYCPEVKISGLADSVVNAMHLVRSLEPDVVFLDIQMPGLDGFDFLKENEKRNFMVVFVSAHEEFGIQAVKAGVVDYILKPINIKELKLCINKLLSMRGGEPKARPVPGLERLVIPSSHGFQILETDEIIRFEADGCYTKVFFKDGKKTLVSRTLKEFEEVLPKEKFFRIHKSNLINLAYLKDYTCHSGTYVTLIDGSRIDISRRRAPDFIQQIKTLLMSV